MKRKYQVDNNCNILYHSIRYKNYIDIFSIRNMFETVSMFSAYHRLIMCIGEIIKIEFWVGDLYLSERSDARRVSQDKSVAATQPQQQLFIAML